MVCGPVIRLKTPARGEVVIIKDRYLITRGKWTRLEVERIHICIGECPVGI